MQELGEDRRDADGPRPSVSAVILAHNRRDAVAHVLERLEGQPLDEVIVVDSGSTDGTAEMIRARAATIRTTEVRLLSPGENVAIAGRNIAAQEARGEYLLMLDDDSYPLPGAVAAMTAALDADPSIGVVGGLVRDVTQPGRHGGPGVVITDQLGSFDWWLRGGRRHRPTSVGTPAFFFPEGASMLRREAFLEVGGFFEPYFFTASEIDVATRLVAAGWDVRYLPAAVFDHMKEQAGRIGSPRALRLRVRNQIWYFWRHFPFAVAARRVPAYLAFDLVEAAYRGALGSWAGGIADAWRDRERVAGTRHPLPREVLRRAEMDRGRLHARLLSGQLRQKLLSAPSTGTAPLVRLADDVDTLHEVVGVPLTARRAWGQRWAEAHPEWRPWSVVVRDPDGALAGAALLARRVRGGLVDVVVLGHGWADQTALPAIDPRAADDLGDALVRALSSLPRPWRLRLEQLPADDPVARRVRDRLPVARLVPGDASPTLRLVPGAGAEVHGSKNYRAQRRRELRRARAAGLDPEFDVVTDPATAGGLLEEITALRRTRDHDFGRVSDVDSAAGRWLFTTLANDLLGAGRLEIATFRLGGEIAAYDLLVSDGPVVRIWDGRMDARFAEYGPGHQLHQATLDRLADRNGVTTLDFGRGEAAHKLRLADGAVAAEHLLAWSSDGVRILTSAPSTTRARLREAAQDRPALLRAWRSAKRAVRELLR